MSAGDTIIALSSGSLPSGVAIIRISGQLTRTLLEAFAGGPPRPRHASLRTIGRNNAIDEGLVLFFPGPRSFTGEDCAELQVHGSRAVIRALLSALAAEPGVRLADAGEFTRRAFLNGKLDLVQVEGLSDLLAAETEAQRRQAGERLAGGLTRDIALWRETLIELRVELEAHLDFSDEGDVGTNLPPHLATGIAELAKTLEHAAARYEGGRIVREGFRVALAGPPNAGKSSLLNALARSDVAIVTSEAGTTRDIKEVPVELGGQLCLFVDMAGLRDTDSLAEAEGVRRARMELDRADLVLWLEPPDQAPIAPPETRAPMIVIPTKGDLPGADAAAISVQTGQGLDDLMTAIRKAAELAIGEGSLLVSHERDRQALLHAAGALRNAGERLHLPELAAEELRRTTHSLETLLGRVDAEMILDRLFAGFCIGK
ncbi:tRNA uridine-5-carboxymethylaminomethyl(34) synthesis GTPase MnmE [Arsenicitalea aurantiaca]|uniref:tRNA modification GTPase MnmE n=1 Tax=Arsenicitalea aurantiaca TaxID=1783274 RepID=A0A433X7V7_9HYPH|nr:tRNA uridine-5-carboxymethylaminomethyl(34) synthesis GTPase MnmE [Arsenicitalea aurantiaca]RUT30145.1 tRNA uridine-5-carboxymethylaminomethyl(34) synthesis GTPase MnmE [Arsenicitalea aurantiaca]